MYFLMYLKIKDILLRYTQYHVQVLYVKCIADTRHDKIMESTYLTVPTYQQYHLHYAYSMNVAIPDALCHDKVRHALYVMHSN